MKKKPVFLITLLMAMAMMLGAATLVWAGTDAGDAPADLASATGPEVWATVVVRCEPGVNIDNNFITLRAKRVKDCNVQTQAQILIEPVRLDSGCPDNSNLFLYEELDAGSIFVADDDIEADWIPIVTKIKNYTVNDWVDADSNGFAETATLSFDAQIKFLDRTP